MKSTGVLVTEPEDGTAALPLRESFPTFYRREYPRMVAIAAAVSTNRAIAEDIAQEAMVRAHRHWGRISSYDRPGAWVRRVTINLSLSATKRAAAEFKRLLHVVDPPVLPEPEVEDGRVWKAVAGLPGNQRAAIALHYLEDRSIEEIATILDTATSTARVHLHRGRQALARTLNNEVSS